jgi:hypothetical protein
MATKKKTTVAPSNDDHHKLIKITLRYGFGEPDLRLRKDRLERGMKRPVDEFEAAFSLFSELLNQTETVHEKVALYFGMAEIVHLHGEDPSRPLIAMHQIDLSTFKDLGFRLVRVESAKDACPECKKISGRIITIEEALASNQLPHRACTVTLKVKNLIYGTSHFTAQVRIIWGMRYNEKIHHRTKGQDSNDQRWPDPGNDR